MRRRVQPAKSRKFGSFLQAGKFTRAWFVRRLRLGEWNSTLNEDIALLNFGDSPMKDLLVILVLLSATVGFVRSDDNIYGPGGVNLGPNGNPDLLYQEIEQQRLLQEQLERRQRQQQQEAIDEYKSGYGLTLRQQNNGHFFVDSAINDIPLVFAIDTGATFVTIAKQVALEAGIECGKEAAIETANGIAKACMGIIAKLKVGHFTITNVQCVIAPNLNHALLGNNALEGFKILQHNGEMRITK